MVSVSDHEIAEALQTLLRDSDPNAFASLNDVVLHLGSNLGFDLSHKVDFIRNQIHLLFRSHPPPLQPPRPSPPPPQSTQHPNQPSNDRFSLHQNPNFPSSPSQLLPNAPVHRPKSEPDSKYVSVTLAAPDAPKQGAKAGTKRKGGSGGLNKLCGVSPELEVIVGKPELTRTEIVKQLWAYIRKNNLQDPSNKRKIICNDELRLVFETDCTDMFKMNKLLAKHIISLEPSKQSGQRSKKTKVDVESGTVSAGSGPPVIISEALASFFAVSEREMPQSEVLRQIWEYIKVNHLEDPSNPMVILCDAKLQGLLGCERISAVAIPEMLACHHLFKIS